MNIAALGPRERLEELSAVLSLAGLTYTRLESTKNIGSANYEVIFDLAFDESPATISDYRDVKASTALFLSCVKIQLEAVIPTAMRKQVTGINALPGFLGRKALECCTLAPGLNEPLIRSLGWEQVNKVGSRVGLVSPRVIFMIINEAYYTLQEGTASREDIDKGMRLGTAYPYGPFEWAKLIGINNIFETLQAVYEDTKDERYRICSLLKTEYLEYSNTITSELQ